MNKVMTRTRRTPGSRPPGRHDTRRPGGATPRTTPGGGTSGTMPGGGASGATRGGTAPSATPDAAEGGMEVSVSAAASTALPSSPLRTPPPPRPRPTDLFADRLVEVLSGRRPVHCMLRHTAGRAYDELAWLAERGLLRTHGTRPVVRDIGYYVPRSGAVEAFARIGAGDQLRAMAFRLEQGPDLRWRCTAVELGGARMPRTAED
ncbi:Rv3235 family protein [Streptomyces sp. NPDC048484]|uniref:Rv3235 family protein n=1 Tax=Streptomyces sp. NPDC048484 TaxID=3155146 RepID=UPI00344338E1